MESNFITKQEKQLKIGDFVLSIRCKHFPKTLAIPYAGMAFYYPEYMIDNCATDFEILLDNTPLQEESEKDKVVFGSKDFYPPTFVHRQEDGGLYWKEIDENESLSLAYHISPDWKNFQLYAYEHKDQGADAFRRLGDLFSYALLNHNACVLHGVVMEYQGKGILVTAASGTGKTTHTRMWREYKQALILNGDRCLCRKCNETWYAYGMPWSGSSGEYMNRRVPISAIVVLERGLENKAEPMTVVPAFKALMKRIFAPQWEADLYQKAMDCCESLAIEIPVYKMHCRPDKESVDVLEKIITRQGL